MKIVAVSDTHNMHDQVVIPNGDVLIHAGDATLGGTFEEIQPFAEWLASQPHKHKIFVPGNHDYICQDLPGFMKSYVFRDIHFLVDRAVTIDGVTFYGMPWVTNLPRWAFNLDDNSPELQSRCAEIPRNTNVLITHGPPHGKLDIVKKPATQACNVGSVTLLDAIKGLTELQYNIFGHIHEGYGATGWYGNGPTFVNVSTCTLEYLATNKPIELEIKRELS